MKSVILFLLKTTKDVQSLTHIFYQRSFHPNDIKLFNSSLPLQPEQDIKRDCVNDNQNFYWRNAFEFIARNAYPDNDEPL